MQPNPFSPGAIRSDPYLVGRESQWALIKRLTNQLEQGSRHSPICFLAPAGLGKTTLLKQLGRDLQQRNWLCGYSEASSDAATAIQDFLSDARRALPPEGIGARFRARLQDLSITAGPVGASFRLGNLDDGTAYMQLAELLTSLGELARLDQVGVALLLDEAQVLPYGDLDLLFRVINRLDELPIAAIMAGLPSIPTAIGSGPRSAPYVFYADLDPLAMDDARLALMAPVEEAGGACEPEALTRLLEYAEGHPLVLQMLGSNAWIETEQETLPDELPLIKLHHASAAINATQSQLDVAVYRPTWKQCKKPEKKLLLALAALSGGTQLEGNLLRGLRPEMRRPEEALDKLVGKGVVCARGNTVRFVVPGFDEFVQRRSAEL